MENADVFLGLQDFLDRMRQPSAADFVKAIKSFIVSFSNNAPDPEKDSSSVQEFLASMEAAFRVHPLWAGCSQEELESAGEGLEKYVMTKLFARVFASLPDDVKLDNQLSEKMALIQQFIQPENLDIKPTFMDETLLLLAQKELQKINMYKAPRDKLVCIVNCCKVISNGLINASVALNENPPGADEFLPVLIYVIIKATPPQLHSNLLYIQRFRRQSRLVAEAAYFLTNLLSSVSFISNIDAKALSMDETEFERNMEYARSLLSEISTDLQDHTTVNDQNSAQLSRAEPFMTKNKALNAESESKKEIADDMPLFNKVPSLSDLENQGASILLKEEDQVTEVFRECPYLFARVGDLTVSDVEDLLNNYKQLVFKYVSLSKGLGVSPTFHLPSNPPKHVQDVAENTLESSGSEPVGVDVNDRSEESADRTKDSSDRVSLSDEKTNGSDLPLSEAVDPHVEANVESPNS